MTGRLDGRVALIIGGARGIGGGIATRFAAEGARIVIADLEDADGMALAAKLGASYHHADVSDPAQAEAIVAAALDLHGRLDILVQNAGIYPWTLIEDTSPEEWNRVLGVNLGGCFLATKAAVKPMKAQGYGRIVLTSSITGPRVTSPGHGHYSASKAGINGFIRAAALEFAGCGITVNGIEPGNILTEGMQAHRSAAFIRDMESAIPVGRMGTPKDIAAAATYLASEEAAFVTGTTIVVDGGQLLPEGNDFRLTVG
ncbi:glucose 1-dehydrogenase [Salipiger mangrovisoli]|uniref:SDR family oxidoreductase n=1 Tax=Salipiger mangrovisoli TaxID=2865933 RepID=A0ABR9X4A1_9RHOB|nr:SDR family oxidoreductase [Salipiger mangrovisoli]